MNMTANKPTIQTENQKPAAPSAAPREAPVSFVPNQFREREYEAQRAGKCIGHVWKYGKAWSVRIGDHFQTSPTLQAAKTRARELAKQ